MAEILAVEGTPELTGEMFKTAEVIDSSSSSDEESAAPRRKAATKKRTLKSFDSIPACGIYSNLSSDAGLKELKFPRNLPAGFLLDDDDEDEDDTFLIKKNKRQEEKHRVASSNNYHDVFVVDDSSPKKNSRIHMDLTSPSPPPSPCYGQGFRHKTRKKTSKILRQLESTVLKYRIASMPSVSESPVMTTPGGSSKVIDLESPSPSKKRKNMTVKIRTRGGVQKFVMQMNEVFSNVIDTLARTEGVDRMKIKIIKENDEIAEYDTPKSAKLRISDILECVIIDPSSVSVDESELNVTPNLDDSVQIKIQGQDRTSKMSFTLLKNHPMGEVMAKYSQSTNIALDKLKFYFDGDVVSSNETAEDLDMDEESTVDVVITA